MAIGLYLVALLPALAACLQSGWWYGALLLVLAAGLTGWFWLAKDYRLLHDRESNQFFICDEQQQSPVQACQLAWVNIWLKTGTTRRCIWRDQVPQSVWKALCRAA